MHESTSVYFPAGMFPSGLNIVVFEPNVIARLGLSRILISLNIENLCQWQVNNIQEITSLPFYLSANAIIASTGSDNHEALALLHLLAHKAESGNTTPVIVRMSRENPSLAHLMLAFGAAGVLSPDATPYSIHHSLAHALKVAQAPAGNNPVLLTRRERQIVLKILAGANLTQIAIQLERDVRTISAHKFKAIAKLRMRTINELQILAGQLSPVAR